jgi:hypothetical protein
MDHSIYTYIHTYTHKHKKKKLTYCKPHTHTHIHTHTYTENQNAQAYKLYSKNIKNETIGTRYVHNNELSKQNIRKLKRREVTKKFHFHMIRIEKKIFHKSQHTLKKKFVTRTNSEAQK